MSTCQAQQIFASARPLASFTPNVGQPLLLAQQAQAEVLDFLAARPLHTVLLASMIRAHGLVSPLNRGSFYGLRNKTQKLEGVALLGHATLIEAQTERALIALARAAQQHARPQMLMGERTPIGRFWQHYAADAALSPRRIAHETLLTLNFPLPVFETTPALRQATTAELDLIVPVQAELACAESGRSPLVADPQGFRARCARRIAQGHTWTVVSAGRLLFKAELQAVTSTVIYLEGIYVDPATRGQGLGVRCLSQLCRTLLLQTDTLSLLVNHENHAAQSFYHKVGFRPEGFYETIFL